MCLRTGREDVGTAPKEICLGRFHSPALASRHGVPAQELPGREERRGLLHDHALGTPGIRDKRTWLDPLAQFGQRFDDAKNRLGQVDQIGRTCALFRGDSGVDYVEFQRAPDGVGRTNAEDAARETGLAKRQRERPADQADAENRDRSHECNVQAA